MIYTARSLSLHRNQIIYKAVCSKTVQQYRNAIHRLFTTIVRIFILKLMLPKMISSLGKVKKTALFQLSAWDCSWTWMESRYLFPYIQETEMNKSPWFRWKKKCFPILNYLSLSYVPMQASLPQQTEYLIPMTRPMVCVDISQHSPLKHWKIFYSNGVWLRTAGYLMAIHLGKNIDYQN